MAGAPGSAMAGAPGSAMAGGPRFCNGGNPEDNFSSFFSCADSWLLTSDSCHSPPENHHGTENRPEATRLVIELRKRA